MKIRSFGLTIILVISMIVFPGIKAQANDQGQELSMKEKKEILSEVGLKNNIPPEIMKAIAMQESGIKQFKNGQPYVSVDGKGYGVMQVTDTTLCTGEAIDTEKVKWDTRYNIEMGAKILKCKWNLSGNRIPTINNQDYSILENWYFATMAYNGLSSRNDPKLTGSSAYQEEVYQILRNYGLFNIKQFPAFDVSYASGSSIMNFPVLQYNWDVETIRSPQMNNKIGDSVYTHDYSINIRNVLDGSGSTGVYKSLTPNTMMKIVSGPHESNEYGRLFSWYGVKIGNESTTSYVASSLIHPELTIFGMDAVNHRHPVARLYIRHSVPLLKKQSNGQFTEYKQLVRGEFYRTYGVEDDYYDVGGGYYVKHDNADMGLYVGRILVEERTPLYAPNGTITRWVEKGEAIRVYSYNANEYEVGGGYTMNKDNKVKYFVGYAKIKNNMNFYKPDGTLLSTLPAGQRYRVYDINGNKLDLGGGNYILDSRTNIDYMKN